MNGKTPNPGVSGAYHWTLSTFAKTHSPAMNPDRSNLTLSPADADALESLLSVRERGTESEGVRVEALAGLLSLLDRLPAEDLPAGLAERVMAAIGEAGAAPMRVALCGEDRAALEAVMLANASGRDHGPVPAGLVERAQVVRGLLSIIDRWPAEDAPTGLADTTVAHIEAARFRLASHDQLAGRAASGGASMAMLIRRVGAAAAVVALMGSVLLPMLSKARQEARETACRANLADAGKGLLSYARDHRDELPRDPATVFDHLSHFADASDGAVPSSAVHLLVLPSEGYLEEAALACPSAEGGVFGGIYSTQNTLGRTITLSQVDGPLMADTSPLYTFGSPMLVRDGSASAWSASKSHGGRGQNLLMADGSAAWTIRPAIVRYLADGATDTADNIWTRDLKASDTDDEGRVDAFLTP